MLPPIGVSDHNVVLFSPNVSPTVAPVTESVCEIYNWKNDDYEALTCYLNSVNWNQVFQIWLMLKSAGMLLLMFCMKPLTCLCLNLILYRISLNLKASGIPVTFVISVLFSCNVYFIAHRSDKVHVWTDSVTVTSTVFIIFYCMCNKCFNLFYCTIYLSLLHTKPHHNTVDTAIVAITSAWYVLSELLTMHIRTHVLYSMLCLEINLFGW